MIHNKYFSIFCVLVFFICCFEDGYAKKIPRWWLKVAQKQGPNACVVEEVPGTQREFWTECRYWLNRKICGVKTLIRFECCEGFEQIDGEDGCTLVKPLKNILETAESLGATKWAQYIRESGLSNELESAGAYTLFAPTNEAFEAASVPLKKQLESYRGNPNNPILLYHIVPSKLKSQEFDGDQMVESRHQGNNIRINKYSNGMTTINCALLLRKDQEATNGIVHIIDGILDPSVGLANNVADMVLNDGRYQIMASMLEKSGYINVLRTLQDSITILAPSDEAFQKLPDSRREKIINDREARLAILQNHVIPHVICESAITGEHKVRSMSNNKLTFNCGPDGAFVEKTKLRGDFSLGKNGIVHMIDDVLLPDRAKNLIELAASRHLSTFVDIVKRSGLEETLSHTGDYTFFVPDETAWLEMPPEALAKSRKDPEYAGLMLRYHGAYGRHLTNAITDNQAIMSLDEENPVRLQVWRRAMGVENAKITESDIEGQNGVIHIINKVIFPSNKSVEDTLSTIRGESFRSFTGALNRVTSEPDSLISLRPGDDRFYTFFVPTDKAFSKQNRGEIDRIMQDKELRRKLVNNHVAMNMFPEISFEPGLIYSINGIGGNNLNIKKSSTGKLTVNGANVLSSHMSAKGVIHVIDGSFMPDDATTYSTVKKTYSTTTYNHGNGQTSRTYSTKRTEKSHHKSVTFTEGHERNLEDILPAYPKGGGTFNYAGHPYGSDVVGHDFSPLPFSAPEVTYVTRGSSVSNEAVDRPADFVMPQGEKIDNYYDLKAITHKKTVNVTHTVYTYPISSSTYVSKSIRISSFPLDSNAIVSSAGSTFQNSKKGPDLVSAYAFTGEDGDFADGAEFSEVRLPSEDVVLEEQAKDLRRQWRRKRHQQRRRKNRKGKRKGKNHPEAKQHKVEKAEK